MDIAALVPLSLSDYPGAVAAVVFARGCNFRCPFCHNPELVLPDLAPRAPRLLDSDVLTCLRERRGFLDAVVVTGGEPTLQPDLAQLLVEIRDLGLRIKLDTNGSRPEDLARLLERRLVDFVAMDLKAPPDRYAEYAGVPVVLETVATSVRLIGQSDVDHEFRTTAAPGLALGDLRTIAEWVRGARRYVLQAFRVPPEKRLIDPAWGARPALSRDELEAAWKQIATLVRAGGVRA